MDIFDSHTHLNQEDLFPNRENLLTNFINEWGKWLINAWANRTYNTNGLLISKKSKILFPNTFVKCALWRHPCDVENIWIDAKKSIDELENKIMDNKDYVVAIGECWIDLHYDPERKTLSLQKQYFKEQCKLAKKLNIPIMIHTREAFNETYEILKEYPELTIYIHCRWYWESEIKTILNTFKKIYIWFCWNITYKNAETLRESIKILPIENLLIETDAPYLSPQGHRWTINSPERVKIIWEYIWSILWIQEEQLRNQIEKNFYNLYVNKK